MYVISKTIDIQIDGTEQNPEIDPHKYGHLIMTKNKGNGACIIGYP